jgi:UDP-glucose 4-epimerase
LDPGSVIIDYSFDVTNILVAGGTGFLGSWLSRYLVSKGHEVTVLARQNSSPWRLGSEFGGDVVALRETQWPDFILRKKFEVFVSCDWAGVEGSERNNPVQLENIKRITNCLDAFIKSKGRYFVGVGSQAEYGNPNHQISENSECAPTTLYGVTKLDTCRRTQAMLSGTGVSWSWARIFSTYGPLDTGNWLLNSAIDSFRENRIMEVTPCEQLWSYLYASDAARALAQIALSEKSQGIYNLGHPLAPPLHDTLLLLHQLMRTESKLNIGAIPYREDQVMVLQPDVTRLQNLGWVPEVSMEKGLLQTAIWRNAELVDDPFSNFSLPVLN